MFRESKNAVQLDAFTSISSFLCGRALGIYDNPKSWHNVFRDQVLNRIDERIFSCLFRDGVGAPNTPVRILVGMIALKNAHRWSDSQLFENCLVNLLVRSALGLFNMSDPVPAESTYYLFLQRIVNWEKEKNVNLIEVVFNKLTEGQLKEFNVNGNKIRLDSKLIGSNIAWYSRYELIHETLRLAYSDFKQSIDSHVSTEDIALLNDVYNEAGNKVSYRSNHEQLSARLSHLGAIIYKFIDHIRGSADSSIEILRTVFHQHFEVANSIVTVRPKEQLSSTNIQSPHDPDCDYGQKPNTKVKGYKINLTETCNPDNDLNLVTNVQLDTASKNDCNFFVPAIEDTQEILSQKIESVYTDGGYYSPSISEFCKENGLEHVLSAITGNPSRYEPILDTDGKLTFKDTVTDIIYTPRRVQTKNPEAPPKWAIKTVDNQTKYFTQISIDAFNHRKQLATRPKEESNLRANVEASIFQLGYHFPNGKTRYRGLQRHKIWANIRCIWINFVRIMKYLVKIDPKNLKNILNPNKNSTFFAFFRKIELKIVSLIFFMPNVRFYATN